MNTKHVYKNNLEPQINDIVTHEANENAEEFRVTDIFGGRVGNKVTAQSLKTGDSRVYYYYCWFPQVSRKFS